MKSQLAGLVMGLSLTTIVGNDHGIHRARAADDQAIAPAKARLAIHEVERAIAAIAASSDPAGDARTRAILQSEIPEINLESQAAADVVSYLSDLTGLNLRVNWTALAAAAIERDAEVTIRLRGVTIEVFLATLCDELGAGETEVGYDVIDGMVTLSTVEDLSRRTLVRIYDVKDLLAWSRTEQKEIIDDLIESVHKYAGGAVIRDALVNGWRPFDDDDSLDTLTETIRLNVDPESWREAGGNVGSICQFNICLIVCQTNRAHRQIDQLLAALRKTRDLRTKQ